MEDRDLRNRNFTNIGSSSVQTVAELQIDTDLLLIITNTADELSSGTNIDDLERERERVYSPNKQT